MEGLGLNNILGEQDIDTLFEDTEEFREQDGSDGDSKRENNPDNQEENDETTEKTTEAVSPDDLFDDEDAEENQPESVGSEEAEEGKGQGGSSTDDGGGTSPENFYSSIANAVAEDGVFPNLDSETVKSATDAESLSKLFDLEVQARLDDAQKRVLEALNNGVEPTDIHRYENTLNFIASIKDSDITVESEKGEQLRYNLIFQDFLNKGYSRERADKLTRRSIDAGTDIEDAKDALQSNREFFQDAYDKLLQDAKVEAEKEEQERQKRAVQLKDSILKDKQLFGDMEISSDVRRKVVENISKPVYKDPDTGEYLTAIQKYEMEHRGDFLKYTGLLFTLTNGFKDFESFTKGKVKKEVKKGLRELEQALSNTRPSGSMNLVTTSNNRSDSLLKGIKLDLK